MCQPRHWAEQVCVATLQERGYTCVASNYRTRFGEFDLLFRTPGELALVEVKQRSSTAFGAAAEMLSNQQLVRITRAYEHFLLSAPTLAHLPVRVDLFLVVGTAAEYQVEYITNITG